MAIKPCRECGASISTEAQPCPQCGAPDPTKGKIAAADPIKDKSAAADPIKDKSAAPEPSKGTAGPGAPTEHKKNRWLIAGGSVFILAAVAIFFASAQPPAQPTQPTPHVAPAPPETAESLAAKYANMTVQQLIDSLPQDYRTTLSRSETLTGDRRSAAISLKTRAELAPQPDPKVLAIISALITKEEHTGPFLHSQGNEYLAKKQYDLAIQKFDEAISVGDTKSFDSRGVAWLAKREYERAIVDFTQAAKFERGNYLIYIHRAEANEQKGDRDSAVSDYRRALSLAPEKNISDKIKATLKRLGF
jgi:tetratricopeptide (TPR) repeat protein